MLSTVVVNHAASSEGGACSSAASAATAATAERRASAAVSDFAALGSRDVEVLSSARRRRHVATVTAASLPAPAEERPALADDSELSVVMRTPQYEGLVYTLHRMKDQEAWVARRAVLLGHELQLYTQSTKSKLSRSFDIRGATAAVIDSHHSPPPRARCVQLELVSGEVVHLALLDQSRLTELLKAVDSAAQCVGTLGHTPESEVASAAPPEEAAAVVERLRQQLGVCDSPPTVEPESEDALRAMSPTKAALLRAERELLQVQHRLALSPTTPMSLRNTTLLPDPIPPAAAPLPRATQTVPADASRPAESQHSAVGGPATPEKQQLPLRSPGSLAAPSERLVAANGDNTHASSSATSASPSLPSQRTTPAKRYDTSHLPFPESDEELDVDPAVEQIAAATMVAVNPGTLQPSPEAPPDSSNAQQSSTQLVASHNNDVGAQQPADIPEHEKSVSPQSTARSSPNQYRDDPRVPGLATAPWWARRFSRVPERTPITAAASVAAAPVSSYADARPLQDPTPQGRVLAPTDRLSALIAARQQKSRVAPAPFPLLLDDSVLVVTAPVDLGLSAIPAAAQLTGSSFGTTAALLPSTPSTEAQENMAEVQQPFKFPSGQPENSRPHSPASPKAPSPNLQLAIAPAVSQDSSTSKRVDAESTKDAEQTSPSAAATAPASAEDTVQPHSPPVPHAAVPRYASQWSTSWLPLPPSPWAPAASMRRFLCAELADLARILAELDRAALATLSGVPDVSLQGPDELDRSRTVIAGVSERIAILGAAAVSAMESVGLGDQISTTTLDSHLPLSDRLRKDVRLLHSAVVQASAGYTLSARLAAAILQTHSWEPALRTGSTALERLQLDRTVADQINQRIERIEQTNARLSAAIGQPITQEVVPLPKLPSGIAIVFDNKPDDTPIMLSPLRVEATSSPARAALGNTLSEPAHVVMTAAAIAGLPEPALPSPHRAPSAAAPPVTNATSPAGFVRTIREILTEPVTTGAVERHKASMLALYVEVAPSKATTAHVNDAWVAYGPRVWPELAKLYGFSRVAAHAVAAGVPLPLLQPGRWEEEAEALQRASTSLHSTALSSAAPTSTTPAHRGSLIPAPPTADAPSHEEVVQPKPRRELAGMVALLKNRAAATTSSAHNDQTQASSSSTPEAASVLDDSGSHVLDASGPVQEWISTEPPPAAHTAAAAEELLSLASNSSELAESGDSNTLAPLQERSTQERAAVAYSNSAAVDRTVDAPAAEKRVRRGLDLTAISAILSALEENTEDADDRLREAAMQAGFSVERLRVVAPTTSTVVPIAPVVPSAPVAPVPSAEWVPTAPQTTSKDRLDVDTVSAAREVRLNSVRSSRRASAASLPAELTDATSTIAVTEAQTQILQEDAESLSIELPANRITIVAQPVEPAQQPAAAAVDIAENLPRQTLELQPAAITGIALPASGDASPAASTEMGAFGPVEAPVSASPRAEAPLLGHRVVLCDPAGAVGTVRYVGPVRFAPGLWIGIELPEPIGKHDGTVAGVHYFSCQANASTGARPGTSASLPFAVFVQAGEIERVLPSASDSSLFNLLSSSNGQMNVVPPPNGRVESDEATGPGDGISSWTASRKSSFSGSPVDLSADGAHGVHALSIASVLRIPASSAAERTGNPAAPVEPGRAAAASKVRGGAPRRAKLSPQRPAVGKTKKNAGFVESTIIVPLENEIADVPTSDSTAAATTAEISTSAGRLYVIPAASSPAPATIDARSASILTQPQSAVMLPDTFSGTSVLASPQLRADPQLRQLALASKGAHSAGQELPSALPDAHHSEQEHDQASAEMSTSGPMPASGMTGQVATDSALAPLHGLRANLPRLPVDVEARVAAPVHGWLEALGLERALPAIATAIAITKAGQTFAAISEDSGPIMVEVSLADVALLAPTPNKAEPHLFQKLLPLVLDHLPDMSDDDKHRFIKDLRGLQAIVPTLQVSSTGQQVASTRNGVNLPSSVMPPPRLPQPADMLGGLAASAESGATTGVPVDAKLTQLPPLSADAFALPPRTAVTQGVSSAPAVVAPSAPAMPTATTANSEAPATRTARIDTATLQAGTGNLVLHDVEVVDDGSGALKVALTQQQLTMLLGVPPPRRLLPPKKATTEHSKLPNVTNRFRPPPPKVAPSVTKASLPSGTAPPASPPTTSRKETQSPRSFKPDLAAAAVHLRDSRAPASERERAHVLQSLLRKARSDIEPPRHAPDASAVTGQPSAEVGIISKPPGTPDAAPTTSPAVATGSSALSRFRNLSAVAEALNSPAKAEGTAPKQQLLMSPPTSPRPHSSSSHITRPGAAPDQFANFLAVHGLFHIQHSLAAFSINTLSQAFQLTKRDLDAMYLPEADVAVLLSALQSERAKQTRQR